MLRRREAFSFVELSIALMAILLFYSLGWPIAQDARARAIDARVGVQLDAWRAALQQSVLRDRGHAPRSLIQIRPLVRGQGGEDPLRWTGSGGSGVIVMGPDGIIRLADTAGHPSTARDSMGRSYAQY